MFNSSIITKVDDCNTILAEASQIKSNLEIKLLSQQRQMENQLELALELPTKLDEANFSLSIQQQFMTGPLPESRKKRAEYRANDYENEIRALEARIQNNGPASYASRSREVACTIGCIDKINEVITAVEARKTELQSSAAA
jgi:hypothetical protein